MRIGCWGHLLRAVTGWGSRRPAQEKHFFRWEHERRFPRVEPGLSVIHPTLSESARYKPHFGMLRHNYSIFSHIYIIELEIKHRFVSFCCRFVNYFENDWKLSWPGFPEYSMWFAGAYSLETSALLHSPGGRLNKKDGLNRYGDSHVKDKTS